MPEGTVSSRLDSLDGVRTFAVGLVILAHSIPRFSGGGIGVSVFFVLSGYLITTLLTREVESFDRVHLGLFYARRALRLYPALLVMLAVTVAFGASLRSGVIAATYTTNLFMTFAHEGVSPFGHTWSLATEEQFYLLWPLLLPFALRHRGRAIVVLSIMAVASVTNCVLGTVLMTEHHRLVNSSVFDPIWQGHGLVIGCLLAFVAHRFVGRIPAARVTAIGLVGVVTVVLVESIDVNPRPDGLWNFGAEASAAVLLLGLLDISNSGALKRLFETRIMVWFGRRSYAIYLWHYPLITMLTDHGLSIYRAAAVGVPLSVLAAALSARWVEKPFLEIKDHMHPRRRGIHRVGFAPTTE